MRNVITASTSVWETIRTPSLLTSRSPSLKVPLSVLQQTHMPKFQIYQNPNSDNHIHRKRKRETHRNFAKATWSVWGRESLRPRPKFPFFMIMILIIGLQITTI
jgi:hypothetical protein